MYMMNNKYTLIYFESYIGRAKSIPETAREINLKSRERMILIIKRSYYTNLIMKQACRSYLSLLNSRK